MKRVMDIVIAAGVLVFCSPVLCLTAVMVRIMLGRPVVFRQERPGLNGRLFTIYKFRTLTDDRDETGELLPDADRMTRFGSLLRKTSLDELPELVNVLKGDMSLVGPRPLLVQYLDRYSPEQARRHHVRPGITGWAQINGRNALTWDEKFQLDTWYVDHRTLILDLKILFLTLIQVFRQDGIHQDGHATAEEFMGNTDHG